MAYAPFTSTPRFSRRPRGLRPGQGSHESLLPVYLEDMGRTDLLDRDEEFRLAKEMKEAGIAFSMALSGLDRASRSKLFGKSAAAGEVRVAVKNSDEVWARIEELSRCGEAAFQRIAIAARPSKVRMDSARDALVTANLRLVVHVARQFAGSGLPLLDLIQEGNIGLIRAVDMFDADLGNRLSTYAFWWIKQSMDRAIASKGRMIRVPIYQYNMQKKIARAVRPLYAELGRMPTAEEVANRIQDESPSDVALAMSLAREPQSLDEIRADSTGHPLLERLEDTSNVPPDRLMFDRQIVDRIRRAIVEVLTPREARIVRLRFGFESDRPCTLEEVGRAVRLSRERVRQLEAQAVAKLRQSGFLGRELSYARGM